MSFYTQQADKIIPIRASTMQEARELTPTGDIIETAERVLMNPQTGSVDFESGWGATDGLVPVRWDVDSQYWVES